MGIQGETGCLVTAISLFADCLRAKGKVLSVNGLCDPTAETGDKLTRTQAVNTKVNNLATIGHFLGVLHSSRDLQGQHFCSK